MRIRSKDEVASVRRFAGNGREAAEAPPPDRRARVAEPASPGMSPGPPPPPRRVPRAERGPRPRPEKSRALEIAKLRGPRERITCYRDVVIAEHDERTLQACQEGLEARHASRMGDEVSRDTDEVGSPLSDPARRPLARTVPAREGRAEVEVGQVADPDAVQSLWESVERDLEHPRPEPTRLDPAVADEHDGGARRRPGRRASRHPRARIGPSPVRQSRGRSGALSQTRLHGHCVS